uniref:Uncharacterized protein n=1 Tax=Aplanochytrium stocchinoi TaxID=215587 RepID=A0A7S3LL52_9STRA
MPLTQRIVRAGAVGLRLLQKGDKTDSPTAGEVITPSPTSEGQDPSNQGNCQLEEADCCNGDFDCVGNLICIEKANWSPDQRFCECSLWYGWNGPDCSQWGVTSYILFFAIFFSSIYLGILLLRAVASFFGVYYKKADEVGVSFKDAMITMVFTFVGAIFLLSWRWMEAINLFQPEEHIVAQDTGDSLAQFGFPAKLQKLVVQSRFMVLLQGVCVVLATLNVYLIWLQQNKDVFTEQHHTFAYKIIRGTQAAFIISTIIVIAAGRLELVAGVALVLLGVIGITYWRFRRRYGDQLDVDTLYYVKGVFITLCLETFFTLLYTIFFVIGWKQFNAKDTPSSFVLLNEGMIFSICATLGYLYSQANFILFHNNWSLHSVNFKKLSMRRLSSNFVSYRSFQFWQNQNNHHPPPGTFGNPYPNAEDTNATFQYGHKPKPTKPPKKGLRV